MKRIRYVVAASLDGYISGPHGEADWILADPDVDFAALWSQFDTLLMGRRTYDAAVARLGRETMQGRTVVVASKTLRQDENPDVLVLPEVTSHAMQALREKTAQDIWLMGGGQLFRFLLEAGEVDTVEVSVMPVLLGEGTPLLPSPGHRAILKLHAHRVYASGIVSLVYDLRKPGVQKQDLLT